MAINNLLRADIMKKLGIKDARFYELIHETKQKYNMPLMKNEVAVCLLASDIGINPRKAKYGIGSKTLDKATEIQSKTVIVPPTSQQNVKSRPKITPKKPKNSKTGKDPLLTTSELLKGDKMGEEVYPFIYALENSMRKLVTLIMTKEYGDNWWDEPSVIPPDVISDVKKSITREQQKPWPGKRGRDVHQINYTLIPHLEKIMTCQKNWKRLFAPIIKDRTFIQAISKSISTLRNNVMHCNPLNSYDIKKVKDNLEEWRRILKEADHIISKLKT